MGLFTFAVWAAAAFGTNASASPGDHRTRQQPNDILQDGAPESVGMLSGPLEDMVLKLTAYTSPANCSRFSNYQIHPIEPGGTVIIGHQNTIPVRGIVHDENAWALDGVAGHAGLFSTARDMAVFCQMLLNNGTYGGFQVLSQEAVDLIFTDLNTRLGSIGSSHGAGFELNQYYTAGPMNTTLTASHTGFTGTSVVVDRGRNAFWVHLANRVHPTRSWSSNNIVRQAIGYWVGKSLGLDIEFPKLT